MQIFLTSPDMDTCARDLDDKRLNKIIVESAQIASTALWINNCDVAETMYANGHCYLPTHEHHPLVVWASENIGHYYFVLRYGKALCKEYKYRFGKVHKTRAIISRLIVGMYSWDIDKNDMFCVMPNCTTNHKYVNDIYEAYRLCLLEKWQEQKVAPVWSNRIRPDWYNQDMSDWW